MPGFMARWAKTAGAYRGRNRLVDIGDHFTYLREDRSVVDINERIGPLSTSPIVALTSKPSGDNEEFHIKRKS